MPLEPGQPEEKADEKQHRPTRADGQCGKQPARPMSRRKCSEQQDDRSYLADEHRNDPQSHERLNQASNYCRPVALVFEMPLNAVAKPIRVGIHGTQASST